MNKTSLFAILGIVLAFTTTLIFGSIVTPASAQGNTTVTMDNMTAPMNNTSGMNMTMDNMTAPMNNTSGMNMTMKNDAVVIGESQVAPPQIAASQAGEGSD